MTHRSRKELFGWGFILWLYGYILGFIFYALVPPDMIGWFIAPFGIALPVYVLLRRVSVGDIRSDIELGIVWAVIAVVFDYVGIVLLLHPENGYYKPDVYFYYVTMLVLPVAIGWARRRAAARVPAAE